MIQRVQSIWLLLAAAAAFFTLKFPFYSGNMFSEDKISKSFAEINAQSSILILVLTVGIGISAIIGIFMYKNRKEQLRICLAGIGAGVINVVLYFLQVKKFVPGEGQYALTAVLVILIPLFLILAARGIYKDQKLLKSLDRLR